MNLYLQSCDEAIKRDVEEVTLITKAYHAIWQLVSKYPKTNINFLLDLIENREKYLPQK